MILNFRCFCLYLFPLGFCRFLSDFLYWFAVLAQNQYIGFPAGPIRRKSDLRAVRPFRSVSSSPSDLSSALCVSHCFHTLSTAPHVTQTRGVHPLAAPSPLITASASLTRPVLSLALSSSARTLSSPSSLSHPPHSLAASFFQFFTFGSYSRHSQRPVFFDFFEKWNVSQLWEIVCRRERVQTVIFRFFVIFLFSKLKKFIFANVLIFIDFSGVWHEYPTEWVEIGESEDILEIKKKHFKKILKIFSFKNSRNILKKINDSIS